MQREGWRWAIFWSVGSGRLKASGAEQPRCSKTILPATGLGPATPPWPQAEVCLWGVLGGGPRTGGMHTVTWAGRCLKPGVTFLPSISNILGVYWESERVRQFFKPALHFFLSLFWHSCFALLFVNRSWLLNLPYYCCTGSSNPPRGLCTVTSPCPGTADALSSFSQFHLTLLSNHPDKPVSLSAYNHWIPHSLDHTCLSVVQKDYVCLEFST